MDCHTAHLLIEAFHDDELGVVEAATLLAHLDVCRACARRHEAARRLKSVFREARPVVECPEALKRRLARSMDRGRRFPRAVPPPVTLFVLAAGLGILVGEALPLRARPASASPSLLAETPVTQRLIGEVFCLRCALDRLRPGSALAGTPHRAVLRTADGRLYTLLPGRPAALEAGCSARRVEVLARLYPENGLAQLVSIHERSAAPRALALARAN